MLSGDEPRITGNTSDSEEENFEDTDVPGESLSALAKKISDLKVGNDIQAEADDLDIDLDDEDLEDVDVDDVDLSD